MDSPRGLLYSQIGYEAGRSMRIIVRGHKDFVRPGAELTLTNVAESDRDLVAPLKLWGEQWGSHWWVAEFSDPQVGLYISGSEQNEWMSNAAADAVEDPTVFWVSALVAEDILWQRTFAHVGYEQGERRAKLAMNKIGWQDCGASWQEANSHAAYVLGFLDILEFKALLLSADERARVERQIRCGLDYLARLQERATEMGTPGGAIVHQTPTLEEILPGDTIKASVAWARAARLLSDVHADSRANYRNRAERAYTWFASHARAEHRNFSHIAQGAPEGYVPPTGVWRTSDLCMQLWAALSLWELANDDVYQTDCVRLAGELLARQVPESASEDGLFGHFRTFPDSPFTEKAWTHHIDAKILGGDAGGHFPHWILPLIRMCRLWPDSTEAPAWREAVSRFALGYFRPACLANPFYILPLGYFHGEGLLWFAGGWHGTTAIYGLAAALAIELGAFLGEPGFRDIAMGNLQWIAGINSGITAESQFASHIFSMEVPDGVALPVSLIHGIGERYAGSWFNARGSICNGFSAGQQFRFDIPATRANDSPSAFTDEDWISHAGAWLSAIARL